MRQKKKLSQIFLRNLNIQKRIAGVLSQSIYSVLIEIGPGAGQITQYLDLSQKRYIGVEIDPQLSSYLSVKFPNLTFLNRDFLRVSDSEISKFIQDEEALLFGNIPYYISTQIFLKFLNWERVREGYFTAQKEFFKNLIAQINTKEYSSISVLFQTFCEIKQLFSIGRLNFFPKPSVDSIFFSLSKKNRIEPTTLKNYSRFIRKCFSQPRKILWNNLISLNIDSNMLSHFFNENGLDKNIRAHQITPQLFYSIFRSSSFQKYSEGILL